MAETPIEIIGRLECLVRHLQGENEELRAKHRGALCAWLVTRNPRDVVRALGLSTGRRSATEREGRAFIYRLYVPTVGSLDAFFSVSDIQESWKFDRQERRLAAERQQLLRARSSAKARGEDIADFEVPSLEVLRKELEFRMAAHKPPESVHREVMR